MLLRILKETFFRRKRRVALAFLAVLLGATLTSALLTVYGDISGKMSQEMRSYGANILVRPRSGDLSLELGGMTYTPPGATGLIDERELPRIKTIFWKANITGIVPSVSTAVRIAGRTAILTGTWFDREIPTPDLNPRQYASKAAPARQTGTFITGVRSVMPWWKLDGQWVKDGDGEGAIVGAALARRLSLSPGDEFKIDRDRASRKLRANAVVSTGGPEEEQVFVSLPVAQQIMGIEYGVDKVLVSALVTPSDRIVESIKGK
ncbi:MAG: hypothetical protein HYY29_03265, partial [Chloroflexi bacterium]|nr:hypothetical protein [Chloroflexota bacterium]